MDWLIGFVVFYGKKVGGGDFYDGGLIFVGEQGLELVNFFVGLYVFFFGIGLFGGGLIVNFNIYFGNLVVIGIVDQVGKSIGQSFVYVFNNGFVLKIEIK